MSSIGVIFRAEGDADSLTKDWKPEPLGTREAVVAAIQQGAPGISCEGPISLFEKMSLWLELEIDEGPYPRSITVAGVWGERELSYVSSLCRQLGARCYDSELSEFID